MTSNGVIALILRFFTDFDSFEVDYVTVVENRPIMSAEYRLLLLAKTDSPCSAVSLRQLSYLSTLLYADRMQS